MSENPFADKTVLVTGASDGVGYPAARRLVDDGASVFVHATTSVAATTPSPA
jgi:NAD(P)-dependent dehydrogenase (short-subunit alcohol dehydrogenase family)